VKRLLSKRVLAVACLLLLALFLLRPDAGWMRARVTGSIAQALGRNVKIGSVRLQFLPRPGFDLQDLVVFDDPAFGAEPLLRASDVNASVRLLALLRGHIEISRLSLSESSLNVTRDLRGRWNIEDLIERTAHTSLAPTGAARHIAAPAFPYIEASDARVNFKLGTEKIHFALTSAEFSLWQDSEDTWSARVQARPMRTDANLTDTGILTATGLWRRSPEIHQTPVQVSFQWKRAEIGQLSKLVYGDDKGWRGGALLSGAIAGTLGHLHLTADASVDDFRRQDVFGGGDLKLAAHCVASYDSAARELSNVDCTAPSGGGYLQLKGSAAGVLLNGQPFAASDLWLVISHVPTESFIASLRHGTTSLPADFTTNGALSANIQIARSGPQQPVSIEGKGSVDGLQIARADPDSQVSLGSVPFSATNDPVERATANAKRRSAKEGWGQLANPDEQRQLRLEIGPVNLATGKPGPLMGEATLTRAGYAASANGDTGLKRLLQVARTLGLPAPTTAAEGPANVKLNISGSWAEGDRPLVTGSAHLRSVRAQVRGLNAPIEVLTADLTVDRDTVIVQNFSAKAAEATWHGSMHIPRPCPSPSACQVQFKLHTAELNASSLNSLLNPALRSTSWYKFLSLGNDQPSYLLQARASGKITIDKLAIGKSECSHFASDLSLEGGTLALSGFRGQFLDGTVTGDWEADFAGKPAKYSGSGNFEQVSLTDVAELMHDGWIDGSGDAKYEFKTSGNNFEELLSSADLTASFRLSGGSFPHVVLNSESGPLRVEDFSGDIHFKDGAFSFQEAKLTSGSEVYTVSGTASVNGALNMRAVTENAGGFALSGTFLRTRVSAIPSAEASLKP
jgi:hypothetical protein